MPAVPRPYAACPAKSEGRSRERRAVQALLHDSELADEHRALPVPWDLAMQLAMDNSTRLLYKHPRSR
jgi:hypothetical protein